MIEPRAHPEGASIEVKAQPGARRNAILGERQGAIRVAVSAPPEKGRANAAIADVLAKELGLKGSQVKLVAGEAARDKRFVIIGLPPAEVARRVVAVLEKLDRG